MGIIYIFIGLAISIIIAILCTAAVTREKQKATEFIENHKKISIGMTKTQIISIMGDRYTRSCLKNNIEKLEWRYRHAGYTGRIAKGAYVHTGSLTRKISVKFKDNKAIEINCINMD